MEYITIKGLRDEINVNIPSLKRKIELCYETVNDVFSNFDADVKTAIAVAKQNHKLRERNLIDADVYNMFGEDSMKLTFKFDDDLDFYFIYHYDAEGSVEYGYYSHDYVYVIDSYSNKTIFDYLIGDGSLSVYC